MTDVVELLSLHTELTALRRRAERLERIAQRRRHSATLQSALYRIADITAADIPMQAFFQALHDIVRQLMYAENFYIALLDEGGASFSMAYFCDTVDDIATADLQRIPVSNLRGTLTGYVLRTGEAQLLNLETMQALKEAGEIADIGAQCREWLGCPLRIGNRVIGVMAVQTYDPDIHLHRSDRKLLQFVSRHIATALERRQKDEQLAAAKRDLELRVEERTHELRAALDQLQHEVDEHSRSEAVRAACYTIAECSFESGDLNEFFAAIHRIVASLMDARNLFIALYDRRTRILSFPYEVDEHTTPPQPEELSPEQLAASPFFVARVISKRQPVLLNRAQIRATGRTDEHLATAWLGVPLLVDNDMTGALVVQSYDEHGQFSSADAELLAFVSTHIAAALKRRHDADDLRAAHDELRRINDDLEQRIEERTQALSATNRVLEQLLEQRKAIADKLAHDAYHDALTGLPNRALLRERLDNTIKRSQRIDGISYALLFLDLDRFKIINDSLGHLVGDRLLTEVSQRLLQCVRPGDTVARLGGDEFCILLDGISDIDAIEQVAERILQRIAAPYMLGENRVYTSTSIGIALSNKEHTRGDLLLRDADAAMYEAKSQGKNRFCFFDPRMHQDVLDRLKLESELRHAVSRGEIQVYYQPIYELRSGTLRAFEALARWISPTLGTISPVMFIPLAEETGLIDDIGRHVLRVAAQQISDWKLLSGRERLAVSVNLSGRQLAQPDFLPFVAGVLKEFSLPAQSLKLEITESLLIHNFDAAQAFLRELQAMHIEILLDDFGTGYSSLNYLHQFPLDTVKIDREFVQRIGEHDKSRAIMQGIRQLAHQLGLSLVAEGVETREQLQILQALQFEYGQGYLFGAPMPAEKAVALLADDAHPAFAKAAQTAQTADG